MARDRESSGAMNVGNPDYSCRRVALRLLLNDPRLFESDSRCAPLCAGSLGASTSMIHTALHRENVRATPYIRQRLSAEWGDATSVFQLLGGYVTDALFDPANQYWIRDAKWEEWLRVCWGFDGDTLTMLGTAALHATAEEFAASMRTLPPVQAPVGARERAADLYDAHIHVGAMPVPVLNWAHLINTGYFVDAGNGRRTVGSAATVERYAFEVRSFLAVARVLFASMADLVKCGADLCDPSVVDRRVAFLDLIANILRGDASRFALCDFLAATIPVEEGSSLKASSDPGRLLDASLLSVLEQERSVVSTLVWHARAGTLAPMYQEIVLAYLRCKGYWFQTGSGLKSTDEGETLDAFRVQAKLGRTGVVQDDIALAEGVRTLYGTAGAPAIADVRIPIVARSSLVEMKRWLQTALRDTEWRIVASLPRFEFADQDRVKHLEVQAVEFLDAILADPELNPRLSGIDTVGLERDTSWRVYIPLIRRLREHVRARATSGMCSVVFHCGEDTVIPLKGICDIWSVVKNGYLGPGDRVAHGLDLLLPVEPQEGQIGIFHAHWEDMKDSILDLLAAGVRGATKNRIAKLWKRLDEEASREPKEVKIDADVATQLATEIRPVVAARLKTIGIAIEICPTSNWRIRKRFLPTEHPVAWWVNEIGGEYFIGTDDPSVNPCTIEAEHFAVRRTLGM